MMAADIQARRDVADLRARIAKLERGAPAAVPRRERFHAILDTVASDFGVTTQELLGEGKAANLAVPRHIAMALARRMLGYSLPRIGRLLNRDHTTVLYGIRRITALAEDNPDLAARIDHLAAALTPQPKKGRRA